MKTTPPRHLPFDTRSVMLIAAMALTGASSVQAQNQPSGTTASPAPFGPTSTVPQPARKQPFAAGPAGTTPKAAPTATSAAFERADANRDGKLSAQEADTLPAIGARFEQLDKDRDGFLSREEFDEGAQS